MRVRRAPDFTGDPGQVLWIAIKEVSAGQRHSGILYRGAGGRAMLLHLAFHHKLRHDEINFAGNYFAARVPLDIDNQIVVAAFAKVVGERASLVPYGFSGQGIVIDDSGAITSTEEGKGLTCATFVVMLFEHLGHTFLAQETWPVRASDIEWRDRIITLLKAHDASDMHVEAIEASDLAPRFRPAEVVGGASFEPSSWPIAYEQAVDLAGEILADMAA